VCLGKGGGERTICIGALGRKGDNSTGRGEQQDTKFRLQPQKRKKKKGGEYKKGKGEVLSGQGSIGAPKGKKRGGGKKEYETSRKREEGRTRWNGNRHRRERGALITKKRRKIGLRRG